MDNIMRISSIGLFFLFLLIGCDSGEEADKDLPEPNYDFTGTWTGTITGASMATTFTMTATHSGNIISGTLENNAGFVFSVDGRAWVNLITLTLIDINQPSYTTRCDGTCDDFYGSGTWYDSAGQSGTWEAFKQ